MTKTSPIYEAVVIGVSAGGIAALEKILPKINPDYPAAIIIVQHMAVGGGNYLVDHFNASCTLPVKEAGDKEKIEAGTIYFAPANYHLLIEPHRSLALSVDKKVNYSRPSIDVLFHSAADAYCRNLIGVILTGANADGSAGLAAVKKRGGLTIVQVPETAEVATMPEAAINACLVDHILSLEQISSLLNNLAEVQKV